MTSEKNIFYRITLRFVLGLDKDRINRIIREASKGSKFFQHAEKKEKELADKIEKMLQDRHSLTQQVGWVDGQCRL